MISIISSDGVRRDVDKEQYMMYWPNLVNLIEMDPTATEFEMSHIDSYCLDKIIEFISLYSNPMNYFGIHRPLKNLALDTTVTREFNDQIVNLEFSGVPKVFIEYLNTIEIELFMPMFKTIFNEKITMLTNLLSAYIAECIAKYGWQKYHYYIMENFGVNKIMAFYDMNMFKRSTIKNFIVNKCLGKFEYIYDKKFVPVNLTEALAMEKTNTYCSKAQCVLNYRKLYKEEMEAARLKLTEEQVAEKRFKEIIGSEHFPDFKDIPVFSKNYVSKNKNYVGPVLGRPYFDPAEKVTKADAPTPLMDINKIVDKYMNDPFQDIDNDDAHSYSNIEDDPEFKGYEDENCNDMIEDFNRRREVRIQVRKYFINKCKINRENAKILHYRMIAGRDKYYESERAFLIGCQVFKFTDNSLELNDPTFEAPPDGNKSQTTGKPTLYQVDKTKRMERIAKERAEKEAVKADKSTLKLTDADAGAGVEETKGEEDDEDEDEDDDDDDEDDDSESEESEHGDDTEPEDLLEETDFASDKYRINEYIQSIFMYVPSDSEDPSMDGFAEMTDEECYNPILIFGKFTGESVY